MTTMTLSSVMISSFLLVVLLLAVNVNTGRGGGRVGGGSGLFVLAEEDDSSSGVTEYFYYNEPNTVVKEYVNEQEGGDGGGMKKMKKENFFMDSVGLSPYVVEFYSPHCPACQEFKPHYMELAKETTAKFPTIEFFAVNCDKYSALCEEEYNVDGYPTIRLFPATTANGNGNAAGKTGIELDNEEATVDKIASTLQVVDQSSAAAAEVDVDVHRRATEVVEEETDEEDPDDINPNTPEDEGDDGEKEDATTDENGDSGDETNSDANAAVEDTADVTADEDKPESGDDGEAEAEDDSAKENKPASGDDEKDDEEVFVADDEAEDAKPSSADDEKEDEEIGTGGGDEEEDVKPASDEEKDDNEEVGADDEGDNDANPASDDDKDGEEEETSDKTDEDSIEIPESKTVDDESDDKDTDAAESKNEDDEDDGGHTDKSPDMDNWNGSGDDADRDITSNDNDIEKDEVQSEEEKDEEPFDDSGDEENLPDVVDINNAPRVRPGHYLARNREKKMNRHSTQFREEKEKYMNRRKGLGAIVRKDGTLDKRGRPLPRYGIEQETKGMKQNTPGSAEYSERRQAILDRLNRARKSRYAVTNLNKESLPFKKDVRKAGLVKKVAERVPVVKRTVKMSEEEELILDATSAFLILLDTGVSLKMESDQQARMSFRKFLDFMSVSLPPEWAIHRLIDDLRRQFMFITKSRQNLQSVVNQHRPNRRGFSRSCRKKGSGFSCGFWKLMHTMTVGTAVHRGGLALIESHMVVAATKTFSPVEAADTLRDFIFHFYTCKPCRDNFVSTYDEPENNRRGERLSDEISSALVADWKELPLWLWEVHNDVSVRLVHERLGSSYGKMGVRNQVSAADEVAVIYPSVKTCILCFNEDSTWNEGEVYNFLERTYWPGIDVDPKNDKLLSFDDETNRLGFVWLLALAILWLVYSTIGKKSSSIHDSLLTAKIMVSSAATAGTKRGKAAGAGKKDG
mmetsp:Transcript_49156/g.119120  ORF Transcript_49156/g.119120 Transcript_49156/m.119120 type:complete len:971 (+) Transcript_49156:128-3040(+)